MLSDLIKGILATEYEANQVKLLVLKKSQESIEQATKEGSEAIADVLKRAESDINQLRRASDKKAMESATELASSTANRLATMRARAENRLDLVAQRIFERIVSI